jgi:hypothetical protein
MSAVLEFVAVVDGIEVNGVDIIAWIAEDLIVSFKVKARPLKGIEVLRAKRAERLEAMRVRFGHDAAFVRSPGSGSLLSSRCRRPLMHLRHTV